MLMFISTLVCTSSFILYFFLQIIRAFASGAAQSISTRSGKSSASSSAASAAVVAIMRDGGPVSVFGCL